MHFDLSMMKYQPAPFPTPFEILDAPYTSKAMQFLYSCTLCEVGIKTKPHTNNCCLSNSRSAIHNTWSYMMKL